MVVVQGGGGKGWSEEGGEGKEEKIVLTSRLSTIVAWTNCWEEEIVNDKNGECQ